MIGRTQCYGISDEELLCDDCSGIVVSVDLSDKSEDCFFKNLYSNSEENSVSRRLEAFIRQRNEFHNATVLSVEAFIEEEVKNSLYLHGSGKDSLNRHEKFSRLSSFFESLSKEASGTKIENDEEEDLLLGSDTEKGSIGRQTVTTGTTGFTRQHLTPTSASFQFSPAKFSTPKREVPQASQSLFPLSLPGVTTVTLPSAAAPQQTLPQASTSAHRNGHLALKRTDSSAEKLSHCSSILNSTNSFGGTALSLECNNIGKLEKSVALPHNYMKCDEINVAGYSMSKGKANNDPRPVERSTTSDKDEVTTGSSSTVSAQNSKDDTFLSGTEPLKIKKICWLKQLPFFEFLETDDMLEVYVTEFDKRPKDVLHSLAKRSVKEKVACWTRKNASKEVLKNAVEYFCDLLTGKTVYGFDGKMLNFNGDEPGKRFSMASIVNSYVSVVQKDDLLAECAAIVLLSLMIRIPEFKSILFSKLFAASPLLCMDKDVCIRELAELNDKDDTDVSEAVNSWCNNQSAVIKLFVLLHCSSTRCSAVVNSGSTEYSSTTLWSLLAVTVMQETPFACALVTEILKLAGGHLMKVYGVQFRKLLEFLSHKTLKTWNIWLRNEASICGLTKMALNYYLSVLQLVLKELSVR